MQPERSTHSAPSVTSWRTRLPFFYGWVIVASLFVTVAIGYGMYYSFSVFFVALLPETGWSRASTAGVFSLFVAVLGLGSALGGALIDRFGPQRLIPAGGLLLSLGLFACSRLTELWQYYLFFGVACGMALAICGFVPAMVLVSRWFSGHQGMAAGITSAGIGLGIVAVVPLTQLLISSFGWRTAYEILAAITLLGIAPQSALLLLSRPRDIGQKADGVDTTIVNSSPTRTREILDQGWASRTWTLRAASSTRQFWLLAAALGFINMTHQMLFVHQAAYLVDGGFSPMLAASAVGMAGFASIFGKIGWGVVSDRLGREWAFSLATVSLLSSMAVLIATRMDPSQWLMLLYVVLFGAGYAATAPVLPTATSDIFAGKSFGAIYGGVSIGQGVGAAFGSWVAGYIFDITGTYLAAFAVGAVAAIIATFALWLAAPRRVRKVITERAVSQTR